MTLMSLTIYYEIEMLQNVIVSRWWTRNCCKENQENLSLLTEKFPLLMLIDA
uniref:Uncharacterized protein n=1 Tax=Anguilla anguilla TaxID=7936 RepID=A0A0E9RPW2_ANGAN